MHVSSRVLYSQNGQDSYSRRFQSRRLTQKRFCKRLVTDGQSSRISAWLSQSRALKKNEHKREALVSAVAAALWDLGTRGGGEEGRKLLGDAVTAYRSALEVFTKADLPQGWAMTQNNLGGALGNQAARTEGSKGAELLAQAVTAYRSALEVRTREQLPQDWARTQNNLGIALQEQAARTEEAKGAELLAQAITAYRSALEGLGISIDGFYITIPNLTEGGRGRDWEFSLPTKKSTDLAHRL